MPQRTESFPLPLPPAIGQMVQVSTWDENQVGMSDVRVFRIAAEKQTYYLKIATKAYPEPLEDEAARVRWLHTHGMAPDMVYYSSLGEYQYLLMTALPGIPVHEIAATHRAEAVRLLAEGLVQLHALPPDDCPFDQSLKAMLRQAGINMAAGRVDESDFDPERQGRSAHDLYQKLLAERPATEDRVVAHGDYCLPNVIIAADAATLHGFVDLGRLGISDRHRDLALCARSITYNFGAEWVQPFYDAYTGASPQIQIEPARIAYYQLLDEFF